MANKRRGTPRSSQEAIDAFKERLNTDHPYRRGKHRKANPKVKPPDDIPSLMEMQAWIA